MDNCKVGPAFPTWITKMVNISDIYMTNASISDAIPYLFWNFSSSISEIYLQNNMIKGKLPASLEHLNHLLYLFLGNNQFEGQIPQFSSPLEGLDLSNNAISGPIPVDIGGMLGDSGSLDVSKNKLSGILPSSICELKKLRFLNLYDNQLSGEIPDCWGGDNNLLLMDFGNNVLSGKVPSSIFSAPHLITLLLGSNNFSGGLPLAQPNSTSLMFLDLGNNRFSGNIPTWSGRRTLTNLKVLSLRSNMLVGEIPTELGNYPSLKVIDLSDNMLSGPIPQSFTTFRAMKESHNGNQSRPTVGWENFMSMNIIMKGRDDEYRMSDLQLPTSMDLSNNNLSEGIREALTEIDGLQNLNLSNNHLTGTIPKSIMRLKNLESLDLSFNNLTGDIPPTMTALTFLNVMNFSFNDLSGRIPTGGQFDSHLDPYIYVGNDHLCGFSLNSCGVNATKNLPSQNNKDAGEKDEVWIYASASLGFVIGFWALVGALFLKKKWRIAFYRYIDQAYDKLYVFVVVNLAKHRRV